MPPPSQTYREWATRLERRAWRRRLALNVAIVLLTVGSVCALFWLAVR